MALRPTLFAALSLAALALAAAGGWLWRAHPHAPAALLAFLKAHASGPLAPLLVVIVYVLGSAVLIPVMALIALTGLAFGPQLGMLYALLGAAVSGACGYGVGRYFGAALVRRYAGPRIEAVRRQLKARGLFAMILVRLVPSGPYTLVNMVAGASSIGFRDFLLGTLLGLTPGILATLGLVHGMRRFWASPGWETAALVLAIAAGLVLLGWLVRRALSRRGAHPTR